jgi:hypothetical protein
LESRKSVIQCKLTLSSRCTCSCHPVFCICIRNG